MQTNSLINLASKEYSRALTPYLNKDIEVIDCVFGELVGEKVIQKATLLKIARGELVRYMAENDIEDPEDIKNFDRLSYLYSEKLSDKNNYIFIKDKK